ncbi:MAG: hypothetical protein HDS65_03155 [Bacteroidales bacterium]|nr:hypothetical protein [Bacteroidales bacterium]
MKKYIKALAAATLAFTGAVAMTACSEDKIYEVDINGVPMASDYEDAIEITVDQSTNTAYFTFNSPGVYPVWIIDGKSYTTSQSFSRYYRKAGDYTVEVKIGNANGISDGTLTKSFTINKTAMSGFGGFVFESEHNLWLGAERRVEFWYAPGWNQIADPEYTLNEESFSLTLPEATTDQWQAQAHVKTDICLAEGESFDGSFIFTANKDIKNITLKLHPDGDDDDGHSFFCNQKINLEAGTPITYWFSDLTAVVPMDNLVFTFDFGGNPEGIEISVENIVLKNHSYDDGTILPEISTTPEPDWVSVTSPENLWNGATITPSFWYAPGWNQIADPGFDMDGNSYTITLPEATFERWQCQVLLNTDIVITDPNVAYDFCCTIESNTALGAVMFKLVETDEGETKHDGNFYFADEAPVADGLSKFWRSTCLPAEGSAPHALSLVLDFGGNPAGVELTISNIILQVHHD